MNTVEPAIHSDPEILGGKPVFVGSRVPFQALVDYLEGGHTLEEFLDDFPSVGRDLPVRALERLGISWWRMRVLLDECVPRQLTWDLAGFEVQTTQQMGWAG